jgi:hypothetical protein
MAVSELRKKVKTKQKRPAACAWRAVDREKPVRKRTDEVDQRALVAPSSSLAMVIDAEVMSSI